MRRTMPRQKPGQSKQTYATPREFLQAVRVLLGIKDFTFDLAASPSNAVVPAYWTAKDDSLSKSPEAWKIKAANGWAWLNPPFADIDPWAEACDRAGDLGTKIAFLVPASVGANWFRDHIYGRADTLFLNGRMSFDGDNLYPKDCMLALYGTHRRGCAIWDWRAANATEPRIRTWHLPPPIRLEKVS